MSPEIHGHRGARGLAPENTVPGFETAFAIGVDAIEMDVGVSADGVVVVSHDARLNPDITRDRSGAWLAHPGPALRDLSYAELAAYDVGRIRPDSDYARRFPAQRGMDGVPMPRLTDVISLAADVAREARVGLNIEAKLSPEDPGASPPAEEFARLLAGDLRRSGAAERSLVQCFDWHLLVHLQALAPEVPTVYLTSRQSWLDNLRPGPGGRSPWTAGYDIAGFGGSIPAAIRAAGGAAWSSYYRELDRAGVEEAHALGLRVLAWTVNEPAEMRTLISLGVDAVITDYPDRLRTVMRERGSRLPAPAPLPARSSR